MKNNYLLKAALVVMVLSVQGFNVAAQSVTFNYTGAVQTWTIPPCVNSITVDVQGARGGHSNISRGGYGGRVECKLAVTPGSVLNIYVGGQGDTAVSVSPTMGGLGGYNGGGNGSWSHSVFAGGGGGGASDIRIAPYTLAERVAVGGGGGGGGYNYSTTDYERGGNGHLVGEQGFHAGSMSVEGGGGGTTSAGGTGGVFFSYITGGNGTLGMGGNSNSGGSGSPSAGGGGGGGLYGGGGGSWGGGGGGASATHGVYATAVTYTAGYNTTGNGIVIITPECLPAGVITGPTFNVCQGSTISLSNPTSVSCGTWTSSAPGVAAIDASTGVVTGVSGGTASITYVVSNPCGGLYAIQSVTVNPAPAAIAGTPTACVGATTTLTNTVAGGTWSSSATGVATIDATGTVTGVSAGSATITYTLPTTCYITSGVSITVCTGAAVNDIRGNKPMLNVYPNPASAELNVELPEGSTSITITDLVGRTVLTKQITTSAAHQLTLNVAGIPAGNYILKTVSNDKTYINKINIR